MKKYIKYIKCVVAFSLFFFGSLFQYIPILIFKIDINTMSNTTSVLLSTFSNFICFVTLVLLYRKDIINGIKDLKEKKGKPLSDGFNYWFIGLMIMVLSNTIISFFSQIGTSTNEESIRLLLNSSWLATISIAVMAPVIEELVWRQSLYDVLKNKTAYVVTSGIVFGALHVFLNPITSFVDVLYLIPYCSMGLAFAYTQYKTKNIMASVTMHIIHNSLNVLSTLIFAGMIIC